MSKKWLLTASMAISLSVIAACGGESEEEAGSDEEQQQEESAESEGQEAEQEQPQAPEVNLDDVPDVVAEVNGEEITKDEFESAYTTTLSMFSMQGMNLEEQDENGEMEAELKASTAEQLVGQRLLVQEAENRDYEADADEVDEILNQQKDQFENDEDYQAALEEQGFTEDDFRAQIEESLRVEQLIEEESQDIEVSEDEIDEQIVAMEEQQAAVAEQAGEDAPEAQTPERDQVEEEVRSQKENERVQELVTELRDDADVTINLDN
ncbi:SurA N-terminal domain-containing protein [Sinobaca sp. H24]|uniref:SurA N-terminal domain-containing protein n=1 Tax=Sinobaca sp. H24 TaxID=2923376 RepID=UPI00207AC86E|nr:SurA N-terminal domain-containing protein [Sinobaca sp. H24]